MRIPLDTQTPFLFKVVSHTLLYSNKSDQKSASSVALLQSVLFKSRERDLFKNINQIILLPSLKSSNCFPSQLKKLQPPCPASEAVCDLAPPFFPISSQPLLLLHTRLQPWVPLLQFLRHQAYYLRPLHSLLVQIFCTDSHITGACSHLDLS